MKMELVDKKEPVLRAQTAKISAFDKKLSVLVGDLFTTLEGMEGVGLAAPQVGKSVSLAVIEYTRGKEDDPQEVKDIPKTVLVNPKITWRSKEIEVQKEACFSLPGVEIDVARPKKIHLVFQDESGKREKIKAKGFFARAIQHEVDHLNGILIIDYK